MKKILMVGMADSIHLANWLENMRGIQVAVILVSSSPHRNVHPKIVKLLANPNNQGLSLSMPMWSRRFGLGLWAVDRIFGERVRGFLVRKLIDLEKPSVIHVVEFQHAGYILLKALKNWTPQRSFSLLVSNYGSDIYWFGRFSKHKTRIQSLLALADLYTSECSRDIALAEKFGYQGHSILIPNTGGVDFLELPALTSKELCSERTVVVIKGYQGKFGRAISGVLALWQERHFLKGLKIVSFSTNLVTALALTIFRLFSGLEVSINLKGRLAHKEILSLMSQARIYIGLSRSDGISTSLLEAMAMGAFPIQTGTSCANEWISDGETGAIVELGDSMNLRRWIRTALQDDTLVNVAQDANAKTISMRYEKKIMAAKVEGLYQEKLLRADRGIDQK